MGFCSDLFISLIGLGRFSANPSARLRFEIYGRRVIGSDKAIRAIVTIKDVFEGQDKDGGKKRRIFSKALGTILAR